jgi:uncharacterized membrane protein
MAVTQAEYVAPDAAGQAPSAAVREPDGHDGPARLIRALKWFSLGLGLARLVAPKRVSRLVGLDGGGRRARVTAAMAAVLSVAALELLSRRQLSRNGGAARRTVTRKRNIEVRKTITVNRPPDEVYAFWHDFENLPRFMTHLESVQITGQGRSHWKAKAPAGRTVEWDAIIIEDQPNERIAWETVAGSDIDHAGLVRFQPAPGNRRTEVRVELRYAPPAGRLGSTLAKLFGEEPEQQIQADLRAFKSVMETGEIVRATAADARREL